MRLTPTAAHVSCGEHCSAIQVLELTSAGMGPAAVTSTVCGPVHGTGVTAGQDVAAAWAYVIA